jgi:hypothetical protein
MHRHGGSKFCGANEEATSANELETESSTRGRTHFTTRNHEEPHYSASVMERKAVPDR